MARVKWRDFSGGLHLSGNADTQPRNTLRHARNIATPANGRLRAMSPALVVKSGGTLSFNVDGMFVYQGSFYAEGTAAGTHNWKRDSGADIWTTVTLPLIVGAGGVYDPTTGVGQQAATVLTANAKSTVVFAPPNDGRKEAVFLADHELSIAGNLIKFTDPTSTVASRWGILPPTQPNVTSSTAASIARDEKYIFTAASDPLEAAGDWTLASADDTALATATALTTSTNPAVDGDSLKLRVERDDSAQITRILAADVDLTTFGAAGSSDEDYIQFFIRIRRPKHLENVEVSFDTTTAGDFKQKFYSRELTFRTVGRKRKKKLIAAGDLIPLEYGKGKKAEKQFLEDHRNAANDLTMTEDQGRQRIPIAKNHWTRVTLPKRSFEESDTGIGASNTPNWATVRAIRFSVQSNKEGRTAVFFDSLKLVGGVGMQGDYQYTYTFRNSSTGTRSNPPITQDGVLKVVTHKNVERHGVAITLPSMLFDAQADQLELWRTVGNGEGFFLCGRIALTTPGTVVAASVINDKTSDYIGLNSAPTAPTNATGSGTYTGFATLEPTELPLDNDSPNDPAFAFRSAAGIHVGRMWWVNNVSTADAFGVAQDGLGQVYYSPQGRYEAVQSFIQVTSGKSDPCQHLIIWQDRIFAFAKTAVYEIIGSDEPFVAVKVEGAPGTTVPFTATAAPEGFFWKASDGIYLFGGNYPQNISDKDLLPIFKTKEAVEEFGASTDFREAVWALGSLWLTLGDAEGGGGFLLIFDASTLSWRYSDSASKFLYYDAPNNRLLGAIATGNIHDLQPVPFNEGSTGAQLSIKTVEQRVGNGQKGIVRKFFLDYDPQGETFVPSIFVDGAQTVLASPSAVNGRRQQEYNLNLPGERFAVGVTATTVNNPWEIYGFELDIYCPEDSLSESGLAGND